MKLTGTLKSEEQFRAAQEAGQPKSSIVERLKKLHLNPFGPQERPGTLACGALAAYRKIVPQWQSNRP